MSDKTLSPFKAYFRLTLQDSINNIFDKDFWDELFKETNEISGNWLAKTALSDFKAPQLKRDANIKFDYDNVLNTYETLYTVNMYHSPIEIELNSYEVKVLQITEIGITFQDKENEVYTIKTDENFKLISVER